MIKSFPKSRPNAPPQFQIYNKAHSEKNKMNLNLAPTFPALPRELCLLRSGEQNPACRLQECRLTPEAGLFVGKPAQGSGHPEERRSLGQFRRESRPGWPLLNCLTSFSSVSSSSSPSTGFPGQVFLVVTSPVCADVASDLQHAAAGE